MSAKPGETNEQANSSAEIEALEADRRRLLELLGSYGRMAESFPDESGHGLYIEMAGMERRLRKINRKLFHSEQESSQSGTK